MKLLKRFFPLGLILLLSYFSWAWLLKFGFYDTHDGLMHLKRFWHFDQAIRHGQLYPRWLPDAFAGLGTPFFNFNWSLPYYAGFLVHLLGVDYLQVFRILMLVSLPLSGWFLYLWLKNRLGQLPAVVAGMFYIYAPYRFLTVYVRGALGEAWAFIFFPLVFWALDNYQKRRFFILGSLSWAALILAHNGLALVMLPVFTSYVLLIPDQKLSWLELWLKVRSLVFGLGLAAFFWLPALLENQYIYFSTFSERTFSFVPFRALLYSRWEGGSVFNGQRLMMSFQIGLTQLLVVGLVLGLVFLNFFVKAFRFQKRLLALFFLAWFFIGALLLVDISRPIWVNTPILKNFLFSFRMLFLLVLAAAVLAGILVKNIRWRWLAALGLVILVIYANRNHWRAVPQTVYMDELVKQPTSLDPGGEILPKWLKKDRLWELVEEKWPEISIIGGGGEVLEFSRQPLKTEATLRLDSSAKVRINRGFFPGWEAEANGKPVELFFEEPKDEGVIYLELPKGEHQLSLKFKDTWPRKMGGMVSLISLLAMGGFLVQRQAMKVLNRWLKSFF